LDKRGQIFSLDFLISLIALTLALGLLIQFAEIKTYNENEELQWLELKGVAETAADLLVSNPDIVCELKDEGGSPLHSLMNCLPHINSLRISQQWMAISADYDCLIETPGAGQQLHPQSYDCKGDPTGSENVYSVDRKVVIFNGGNRYQISKGELEDCLKSDPNCKMYEQTVRLRVWKA